MPGLKFERCPNCGAPIKKRVPQGTTYICPYCKTELEAPAPPPQTSRAPQNLDYGSYYYDDPLKRVVIYALVGGLVFMSVGGFVYSMIRQATKKPKVTQTETIVPKSPVPVKEPLAPKVEAVAPRVPDGQGKLAVAKAVSALEMKGCRKQLLPPSTVKGTQSVQTKFIAKKGCVHILADTGDTGESLTLTMKTPKRKRVDTPPASGSIHFVFCPKKSGKHPLTITAADWDMYTVAAIECPLE